MKLVTDLGHLLPNFNKFSHCIDIFFVPGLKSSAVVKDKSMILVRSDLVIYVGFAWLFIQHFLEESRQSQIMP